MKKMIKNLLGVFLITVTVIISLRGMNFVFQTKVEKFLFLDQIVDRAKEIIKGPFPSEAQRVAKKELERLMQDENLDFLTKYAIIDDIEVIQNAAGKNETQELLDAYKRLQGAIAKRKVELDDTYKDLEILTGDSTVQLGVVPRDKKQELQELIDYNAAMDLTDKYVATLPIKEQKEYRLKNEEEYRRYVAEDRYNYDNILLMFDIAKEAKNVLEGSRELQENAKKALAILMNDEKLYPHIKNEIQNDIEIIQKAVNKGLFQDAHNAYNRLRRVLMYRINQPHGADMGFYAIDTRSRMQQAIDYVSKKFQGIKQAIGAMWYAKEK